MQTPAQTDAPLKLEIAHVLLVDVVGYSKLLVNEQIELLQELNRVVRTSPHFRAAEASGKLIRLPTGDGMALLFFDSAEAPVECALEISAAVKSDPRMQLRMGAHSGPIKEVMDVNDRANFAGAGINMAQRVLDCGDAGHILLSKRLAEDLSSYRHWHGYLQDLGECEVKHGVRMHLFNLCKEGLGNPVIPQRVRQQRRRLEKVRAATRRLTAGSPLRKAALIAACLLVSAAIAFGLWIALQSDGERSIAVLPFGNLSAEQDTAFFVDGMQDEILTDLSKVAGLKVISRTSLMKYKAAAQRNVREIAQSLGVSHVLEGNVQRIGNRIRVHAQLTEAKSDSHVWADRYDGELADVFAIQSEIAERIAAQLRIRLSPDVKAAIEEAPTRDLVAYDLYARAKSLIDAAVFSASAKEELLTAAEMLNQAVARDAKFFLAFYQLAHVHDQLYLRFDRTAARLAAAESAIQRVEQLQPGAGEAHLARAKHLYWGHADYDRARAELAIAQRALPNDPMPALLTGYIDRRQGRWEQSTRNLERALELDPRNSYTLRQIALTYYNQRRFAEMARVLDRAVALAPDDIIAQAQRAAVDIDWRANTKPLHAVVQSAVAASPDAARKISDIWMELTFVERDAEASERALAFLSENGCHIEAIPFPRSWCEGLAARLRGDEEAARRAFTATREEALSLVRDMPEYAGAACVLGMAAAALGEKEEAIHAGRRAVELLPISKDALNGPLLVGYLAIIYAWTGQNDVALEQLERATSVPSFWSYGNLVLHPYWDPLRGDPRFEKLVASLAPRK